MNGDGELSHDGSESVSSSEAAEGEVRGALNLVSDPMFHFGPRFANKGL